MLWLWIPNFGGKIYLHFQCRSGLWLSSLKIHVIGFPFPKRSCFLFVLTSLNYVRFTSEKSKLYRKVETFCDIKTTKLPIWHLIKWWKLYNLRANCICNFLVSALWRVSNSRNLRFEKTLNILNWKRENKFLALGKN